MDLKLKGKKILITGSTQGIGKAIAISFLQEGANVIINGRKVEKLQFVVDELKQMYPEQSVYGFQGNVLQEEDLIRLKEFVINVFGEVDVIVPNVGSGKPMQENKLLDKEWRSLMNTNLYSVINVIEILSDCIRKKGGNIVLISSVVAQLYSSAPYAYAASKNALLTLNKYLAVDLAEKDIRINCIMPGNIFFSGGRWDELLERNFMGVNEMLNRDVPMKRFGTPEEIADAVVFLASEKSGFTTGAVLAVDGGQLSKA